MIEKLIHEATQLEASAKQAEAASQVQYETLVADTNGSVADLQSQVTTKTQERAQAKKDKIDTESDVVDTVNEWEGLNKEMLNLHSECDFLIKNYDITHDARAQEIEA